jgi:hypothetical protein
MGHSSPTVTLNIYAHLMKGENQEAACRLEKTIFQGTGHNLVTNEKRGKPQMANPSLSLVGGTGIEPVTSTV